MAHKNTVKVVFFSNWLGNPYKELLTKYLSLFEVSVKEHLWSIIFLGKVFEDTQADVVHLHTLHPFFMDNRSPAHTLVRFILFSTQLLFLKLAGSKIVWTVHELNDKLYSGKGNIPFLYALILGKLIDAFITHCETTKSDVVALFRVTDKKIYVIVHGNYLETYKNEVSQAEARNLLGLPPAHLVFLCFGHIYRYKGVLETIRAFSSLNQDNVHLVIAGSPKEGLLFSIKSMLQECKNVYFIPEAIPDEEVQVYMNACDCVVAAYNTFTTSGIVMLAMSFGRACIVPEKGYFSDVLDSSGAIFYPPDENDGLLRAMRHAAIKRGELLDMGIYNLSRAKQWSWEYVAKETCKVYHSILNP